MSKIIPISKKPKFIYVVDDVDFGIYYYLVDVILRPQSNNSDVGLWHIKYKIKLDE